MPQTETSYSHFQLAAQFVNQTGSSIFLTGKAGTGKTTFLKYIREHSFKKMAIVAPTGVAAINAGGVTMHSFFQLPFGIFVSGDAHINKWDAGHLEIVDQNTLFKNIRFSREKRDLLQELELLVIDEVSMVRADMLDATDAILRHFRNQPSKPFGGVQVLFIGDLFQLSPVIKNEEWEFFKSWYASPFFFDAKVVKESPPIFIELKKIWRQNDEAFITILNDIRNNTASKLQLQELHRYYKPNFRPAKEDGYITLTTHNNKADAINHTELKSLPGKIHEFEAGVEGDFLEKAFPADKTLSLKEGAQIMFIKNDKGEVRRYFNGKIGIISRIKGEDVYVKFPGQQKELLVEKETWKNIRYRYNKDTDRVEEEMLGSFSQYPIRLAWAITIHKSQGLTFEKAIIDAGESFAPGQVYVALSRLTSLNGLVLYSQIHPDCIQTDNRVLEFSSYEINDDAMLESLGEQQKIYIHQSLLALFDFSKLREVFNDNYQEYAHRQIPDKTTAVLWAMQMVETVNQQFQIAEKFKRQLEQLLVDTSETGYAALQQRVSLAFEYFKKVLDDFRASIEKHRNEFRIKPRIIKYVKTLNELSAAIARKEQRLKQALSITSVMEKGSDISEILAFVEEQKKKPLIQQSEKSAGKPVAEKKPVGETRNISLDLFRNGKTIHEIASLRSLTTTTIEGHLASFIETGETNIKELVPEHKIQSILEAVEKTDGTSASRIKELLGDEFTYGEIRAVLNYRKTLKYE